MFQLQSWRVKLIPECITVKGAYGGVKPIEYAAVNSDASTAIALEDMMI